MNEHVKEIEACSSHNLFGNVRIQDDLLVERDHRLAVDLLVIADRAGVIAGDLREGKIFAKNISRDLLHDAELSERTSCIDFLPMTTSKFMCPLPKGKKPPRGVWTPIDKKMSKLHQFKTTRVDSIVLYPLYGTLRLNFLQTFVWT